MVQKAFSNLASNQASVRYINAGSSCALFGRAVTSGRLEGKDESVVSRENEQRDLRYEVRLSDLVT